MTFVIFSRDSDVAFDTAKLKMLGFLVQHEGVSYGRSKTTNDVHVITDALIHVYRDTGSSILMESLLLLLL